LREQPAEDHRIGNIRDVEFVETQQPRFIRDRRGGALDRIVLALVLTIGVDSLMHVRHEFMEMRTALALDAACLKKQVHQQRLAAADVAVDVKTAHQARFVALTEQPTERGGFAREPVLGQRIFQPLEMADQSKLRRIPFDFAGRDQRSVGIAQVGWHQDAAPSG
jgi:hypothetical protein